MASAISWCVGALLILCAAAADARAQGWPRVHVIDIKGAIGVATQRQLNLALEKSKSEGGAALIIRLDTPAGSCRQPGK